MAVPDPWVLPTSGSTETRSIRREAEVHERVVELLLRADAMDGEGHSADGRTERDPLLLRFHAEITGRRDQRDRGEQEGSEPEWQAFSASSIGSVTVLSDATGDSEIYLVEVALRDAAPITVVILVDHNLGGSVKSLTVAPLSVGTLVEAVAEADGGRVDPAAARLRLTSARRRHPGWGMHNAPVRPLLDWVIRCLPSGAAPDMGPTWGLRERSDLTRRFFASPWGRPIHDADREHLVRRIIVHRLDAGDDPTRWSPIAAESELLGRLLWDQELSERQRLQARDVLRALVGYCHEQSAKPASLTEATMSSIDRAATTLAQRVGPQMWDELDDADPWDDWDDDLGGLLATVGGPRELFALDAEPLVDDGFPVELVAVSARESIVGLLGVVARTCASLFDDELRIATERLVLLLLERDHAVLLRGRLEGTAAALLWITALENGAFERHGVLVRTLMSTLGLSGTTPSQRADVLLAALGVAHAPGGPRLGRSHLLTSAARARLIQRRDRIVGPPPDGSAG